MDDDWSNGGVNWERHTSTLPVEEQMFCEHQEQYNYANFASANG